MTMDVISSPTEVSAPRRRPRPWLSYAAMILAGLLLGATGIAVASDATPSATTSPSSAATADEDDKGQAKAENKANDKDRRSGPGAKNKGKWNKVGKNLLRGGPRGALHGEFVVPAGDDTFQTVAVQRGKASAVSATSITVRSDDGYSATYAITADTRVKARGGATSVAKGSEVHVVALRKGARLTAQLVHDRGAPGQARDKPKPKPSPTSS